MSTPQPPEGYATWLDRVIADKDQPVDDMSWRSEVLELARSDLAALRGENRLLRERATLRWRRSELEEKT